MMKKKKKILVLHGRQQTGTLLVGRMDKFRKRLNSMGYEFIAPDAPYDVLVEAQEQHDEQQQEEENNNSNPRSKLGQGERRTLQRQWWDRVGNSYQGLEYCIQQLREIWRDDDGDDANGTSGNFVGILGFSQGARLAHLLTICHTWDPIHYFPGLLFTILASGYDVQQQQQQEDQSSSSNIRPVCLLPDEMKSILLNTTTTTNTNHNVGEHTPIQQRIMNELLLQPQQQHDKAKKINEDSKKNKIGNRNSYYDPLIPIPSLHIYGLQDQWVKPEQSKALCRYYVNPQIHIHPSGHHIPMRAQNVQTYIDFITHATSTNNILPPPFDIPMDTIMMSTNGARYTASHHTPLMTNQEEEFRIEMAQIQCEEVEALMAIFPDEFTLLSPTRTASGGTEEGESSALSTTTAFSPMSFSLPIQYKIQFTTTTSTTTTIECWWPPHSISIQFSYPYNYPQESIPGIQILPNENNLIEFPITLSNACIETMEQVAYQEQGMPCVLSCLYAARDFFDLGTAAAIIATTTLSSAAPEHNLISNSNNNNNNLMLHTSVNSDNYDDHNNHTTMTTSGVKQCSEDEIRICIQQGLDISKQLIDKLTFMAETQHSSSSSSSTSSRRGHGVWEYTIGLCGKPSAGKSTFFNTATAFARQRNDGENVLGGASMAPHPFTTIDPNIGYCLVPAPMGSCPEDMLYNNQISSSSSHDGNELIIACTHGRDHLKRRLIPILLKDVAGLVPGAYQGRGRGNQFLNDLTDADVLIHVLDASGLSDEGGNVVGLEQDGTPSPGASHPLNDLAWIRTELIEWVYTNVMHKWDVIRRRGRSKLADMFSGYGQAQQVTWSVLNAVEEYMVQTMIKFKGDHHPLEHLEEWDQGDIHRLISAFLAVRFPMVLALNKVDLPTSQQHVTDITTALPIHGAQVAIPVSARDEMNFVRQHVIEAATANAPSTLLQAAEEVRVARAPTGVWDCLQAALTVREPLLVFPVSDFTTYAPLVGLNKVATEDASLPHAGMITCIAAAGGSSPSCWDTEHQVYSLTHGGRTGSKKNSPAAKTNACALRDVVLMKPGSTVEDVFLVLKRHHAIRGEFVRAEGAGEIGEVAKPISKHQTITRRIRIVRIMTNQRTSWQSKK